MPSRFFSLMVAARKRERSESNIAYR
jgi:hypothetical protein